ncbi:FAD-dependent oxidoreductase [Ectobacillus panaciterrae]|uniref:FAD-dependent oxidoreductase n=1 Tax=Ectobacillus panaciterrae TaxID=363872 RepID=UPI000415FD7D|nr:FAD-dependent monooxygenase [Ectobacillus panaciterrae]
MKKQAVVIGGSIAGKLAARVLSDFFEEVLVFDADKKQTDTNPRKRVPQGYHSHALLKAGEIALQDLFPGFIEEMVAAGSVKLDFIKDVKWAHYGGWKNRFTSGYHIIQQSRPFLERHIQKRIDPISNIYIHEEMNVKELLVTEDKTCVKGILAVNKHTQVEQEVYADLVIDASGFGSPAVKWLEQLSYYVPIESVPINLFYASQMYQLSSAEKPEWKTLLMNPMLPESPRGGAVLTLEGQTYCVTVSGYMGEKAPENEEEFLSYTKQLPYPDIYEFIQQAEPISDIKIHRIPSQVRRQYEKMDRMPQAFLAIGDAYCRFDPVFGQGMTVAALEAQVLRQCLAEIQQTANIDLEKQYFSRCKRIIDTAWDMTITELYRHPQVVGRRPLGSSFKQWLSKGVFETSASNPKVYRKLVDVMHLMQGAMTLAAPSVLYEIIKHNFASRNNKKDHTRYIETNIEK